MGRLWMHPEIHQTTNSVPAEQTDVEQKPPAKPLCNQTNIMSAERFLSSTLCARVRVCAEGTRQNRVYVQCDRVAWLINSYFDFPISGYRTSKSVVTVLLKPRFWLRCVHILNDHNTVCLIFLSCESNLVFETRSVKSENNYTDLTPFIITIMAAFCTTVVV